MKGQIHTLDEDSSICHFSFILFLTVICKKNMLFAHICTQMDLSFLLKIAVYLPTMRNIYHNKHIKQMVLDVFCSHEMTRSLWYARVTKWNLCCWTLGQKALALYKPGFSTVTLMLPNNIVTHGVHLGIITGSKGVAAALKEGVAPHWLLMSKLWNAMVVALKRSSAYLKLLHSSDIPLSVTFGVGHAWNLLNSALKIKSAMP